MLLLRDLRRAHEHARALGVWPAVLPKTFWGGCGGFLVVLSLAGTLGFGSGGVGGAAVATGVLYAARGVGTGVGPFLARGLCGEDDRALRLQIAAGFLVAAGGYAAFGLCDTLWVAAAWIAVAHLGGATLWVCSSVLWQRHVASDFRGRVFALESLGKDLAFCLGGLLAGVTYDLSASLALTVGATAGLVAACGLIWARLARAGPAPGLAIHERLARPIALDHLARAGTAPGLATGPGPALDSPEGGLGGPPLTYLRTGG